VIRCIRQQTEWANGGSSKKVSPNVGQFFPIRVKHNIAKRERTAEIGKMDCELLELILMNKNEEKKNLHYWALHPPQVLESLVANACVAESFQESIEFCSQEGKLIVVFWSDKGGSSTSLLLHIANRSDGNAPKYCLPLAVYEDGAQRTTTICPRRYWVKRSWQRTSCSLLLNDALHLVVIMPKHSDGHLEDGMGILLVIQNRSSDVTRIAVDSLPDLNLGEEEDNFPDTIVATAWDNYSFPRKQTSRPMIQTYTFKLSWPRETMNT
jgi:hypothetical protein